LIFDLNGFYFASARLGLGFLDADFEFESEPDPFAVADLVYISLVAFVYASLNEEP
jgi:hypothetical protein